MKPKSNKRPIEAHRSHDFTDDQPRVLDAFATDDARHVLYGTQAQKVWIEIGDLIRNPKDKHAELANRGIVRTRKEFDHATNQILSHEDFRTGARVVTRPGWRGRKYYFRDGSTNLRAKPSSEPLIGFEVDPRFSPRGTFDGWRRGIGRIVENQPLPLTVLAASFVGPILKFLPSGSETVMLELVGQPESGKTILLVLAASVWGGKPNKKEGAADTWNMTAAAVDQRKIRAADGLLGLDEANTGGEASVRRELIRSTIFNLSSSASKERYGDTTLLESARTVLISTSNEPIPSLFNRGHADDALRTRILTILVPARDDGGALRTVPKGFDNAVDAIQTLRAQIDLNYGCASRLFIDALATRRPKHIKSAIKRYRRLFLERTATTGIASARHRDMLASIYAAGRLARRFGIFPKNWKFSVKQILRAVGCSPRRTQRSPIERIQRYFRDREGKFIDCSFPPLGSSTKSLSRLPGFRRNTKLGRELLIPVSKFERYFKGSEALLRTLYAEGIIVGEGGSKPKRSIHLPRKFGCNIRVYRILLDKLNKN